MEITDEMLAHAAAEVDQAMCEQFREDNVPEHKFSQEFEDKMTALFSAIDARVTNLTPSCHGKDCRSNGEHPGVECQCDECDYYLTCFPDWRKQIERS